MTTLQKTVTALSLTAAVSVGIYEARQASILRSRNQLLQQQQAEQLQQLQRERDEAMAKQAQLQDENARFNRNNSELLRLRGEVTRLRSEIADANLSSKSKAATEDLQPSVEQAATNASPVETYSATARAVVPWNHALVTGGWKTPSDKMVYVLAVPKRVEDPAVVRIETRVMEVSVEAATKLGLDQSNTGNKETKLSAVLTTELYETIVKAANDTNAVAIIDSPRITMLTGSQGQIKSMSVKETRVGEEYSVGPTLTFTPAISDDGQSVDLGMIANVKYPSLAASQ